jgi:linoleoyl-CoA desaturase
MKTIKFVAATPQQHQFAAALRKNVNDYFKSNNISTKGNLYMAFQTIAMLMLYVGPFVAILTMPMSAWLALPLMVVMGIGMAGIGMCVMHDAIHGSYSEKDWVNKLIGSSIYLLGSNKLNWKIQHNVLHHTYTNIDNYDQDIASRGPIRLSEHAPIKKIHRNQHIHAFFFYGLMTLSKLTKDFTQLVEFNKAGLTKQHHIHPTAEYVKMVLIKMTYLFVLIGLPVLLTPFTWWQALIGFFVMHWTTGCILSTVFQMAHVVEGAKQPMPNEQGVINTEWAVHELQTTSDFARGNAFLNWYVGGLNFQIEHHLFPNICHVHYQKMAPIVESTAKEFGLSYNLKPSFLDALASHVRRLRELGRPIPA